MSARTQRSFFRALAALLALIGVLVIQAWFAAGIAFRSLRSPKDTLYASLASGFLNGHLHLITQPDPRLTALPNPYDPPSRAGIPFLWDASYLNGRYYLYFSPLPALLVHIPYRLVFGAYPSDELAGLVFSIWSLIAAVAFVWRALSSLERLAVPLWLWVFLVGLGSAISFVIAEIRFYELPILAGMAMTASWSYALLRFLEAPSTARAVWMTSWLALAIAARPNVGVLLFVTAAGMVMSLPRCERRVRIVLAAIAPLAIVAAAMLSYNVARFRRPFEFGHSYQLTGVSMQGRRVCGICNVREAERFINSAIHYVFWPVTVDSRFPFAHMEYAHLDATVSFPTSEQVVGVAPLLPLVIPATLLALMLSLTDIDGDALTRGGLLVTLSAWLILFGLCSCWYVVVRYELDFMLLLVMGTAPCIERGLAFLREHGVRVLPLRVMSAALAAYSIVLGLLLGFAGRDDAFRRFHHDLFERITAWFS